VNRVNGVNFGACAGGRRRAPRYDVILGERHRMYVRHAAACAALLVMVLASPLGAQDPTPAAPSPATVAMRWQWLNPEVNSFTFRDTDAVFESRAVARAGPVWQLPRRDGFVLPQARAGGRPASYDAFAEATRTNALLVIRDGAIVFEDYRNRMEPATRHIGFSMTKTITAMLVGQALARGEIASLDDRADKYVPELAGGGYGGVTVRHLLEMRSGAAIEERYDFGENPSLAGRIHEAAIVLNRARFADFAVDVARRSAPGSEFNYATLDTAVLGWVLERATGQRIEALMQQRIWAPLGAEADGFFLADGAPGTGRALNGMGFNATLRDFGRLGLLLLGDGMRGNERILPQGWVAAMTAMKPLEPAAGFPGYGFQTWQVDDEPGAFAAVGLAGQMIYVHPASRTVIVKLSYWLPVPDETTVPDTLAFFKAIARAPAPR
jgi:CubicO group peptidase (beta-lactamase class C family)